MLGNLAYCSQFASTPRTTSSGVANWRPINTVVATSESVPKPWVGEAQRKLTELTNMPAGWDGYGAPAIDRQLGMFVLEVLHKLMKDSTPVPYLVPSSVGGVQLEWHRNRVDLEIHVTAPYEVEIFYFNHDTGDEKEFTLSDNIAEIAPLVAHLGN